MAKKKIKVTGTRAQADVARVYDAKQEHVFRFWEDLNEEERHNLLKQVSEIDYQLLNSLVQKFVIASEPTRTFKTLAPPDVIKIPSTDESRSYAERACEVGEEALREGKIGLFLVAGGQATRLGFAGPKGAYPIGPVTGKSFFQIFAERIRALKKKYKASLPWFIMTSENNDEETKNFFHQNHYFGMSPVDVTFVKQSMIPAVDKRGKLILEETCSIFRNPNGHGGALQAMHGHGVLEACQNSGITDLFYFQVDNILVKVADPTFIGYHLMENAELSVKVVAKKDPDERVGVLGFIDGTLGVIEYSDMSANDLTAKESDGSLSYNAGNTAIHMINVGFAERIMSSGFSLPYHRAEKAIPYISREGELVKPKKPNGIKFETFIFDALRDARSSVLMEVVRGEEFSPVKNETGDDSPETAQQDLVNLFGKWLEKCGIKVPRDAGGNVEGKIEINPLTAASQEELAKELPDDFSF
ncbi:MAG: UTP--glucose-1-phosphate uridylyltransferase, partial [Planctomycetota bacterium]